MTLKSQDKQTQKRKQLEMETCCIFGTYLIWPQGLLVRFLDSKSQNLQIKKWKHVVFFGADLFYTQEVLVIINGTMVTGKPENSQICAKYAKGMPKSSCDALPFLFHAFLAILTFLGHLWFTKFFCKW